MSSLAKNFIVSPVLGLAAFFIYQFFETGTFFIPSTSLHAISIATYIVAVFAGGLIVSAGNQHYYYDEDDEGRESGSVKWFNAKKGYGFITRDAGDDIFVHYRNLEGDGNRSIADGQRVTFVVVNSDKGLQAEEVEIE